MSFQIVEIFLTSGDPLKAKGQGQNLKTLKSNISKTVRDRERECQWELNRKSYMGFQMVKICLTPGDP